MFTTTLQLLSPGNQMRKFGHAITSSSSWVKFLTPVESLGSAPLTLCSNLFKKLHLWEYLLCHFSMWRRGGKDSPQMLHLYFQSCWNLETEGGSQPLGVRWVSGTKVPDLEISLHLVHHCLLPSLSGRSRNLCWEGSSKQVPLLHSG